MRSFAPVIHNHHSCNRAIVQQYRDDIGDNSAIKFIISPRPKDRESLPFDHDTDSIYWPIVVVSEGTDIGTPEAKKIGEEQKGGEVSPTPSAGLATARRGTARPTEPKTKRKAWSPIPCQASSPDKRAGRERTALGFPPDETIAPGAGGSEQKGGACGGGARWAGCRGID